MNPRLLTRTHYQVDEPAYLRVLLIRCTSPIRSEHKERVANRLTRELKALGGLNVAAAKYAIDLGRATGLLHDSNVWTERGHVLGLIASAESATRGMDLSVREKVFFLRTFLEADGAALVYFLHKLALGQLLPIETENWNAIANDLFITTYRSYGFLSTDVTDRIRLRQLIQKRLARPFSGAHSGEHQCFVHVQTMLRLGLAEKAPEGTSRVYKCAEGRGSEDVRYLAGQLPDVETLEAAVKKQRWTEYASRLYAPSVAQDTPAGNEDDDSFYEDLFDVYRKVSSNGVPMCALRTLVEAVQIEEVVRGQKVGSFDKRLDDLRRLQRRHPKKVHFHVDRAGRPAYLKLDSGLHRD